MRLHNVLMATHLADRCRVCTRRRFGGDEHLVRHDSGRSVGVATSLLGLAVGFLLAGRLVNGVAALERTMAIGDGAHVQATGIVEFDRLGERSADAGDALVGSCGQQP